MAIKRGLSGTGFHRSRSGGSRYPIVILVCFALLAPFVFLTGRRIYPTVKFGWSSMQSSALFLHYPNFLELLLFIYLFVLVWTCSQDLVLTEGGEYNKVPFLEWITAETVWVDTYPWFHDIITNIACLYDLCGCMVLLFSVHWSLNFGKSLGLFVYSKILFFLIIR